MKEKGLENRIGNYVSQSDYVVIKYVVMLRRDKPEKDKKYTIEEKQETRLLRSFIKSKAYEYKIKDSSSNHIKLYIDVRNFALTIPRYIERVLPFKFPQQELLQLVSRKELHR